MWSPHCGLWLRNKIGRFLFKIGTFWVENQVILSWKSGDFELKIRWCQVEGITAERQRRQWEVESRKASPRLENCLRPVITIQMRAIIISIREHHKQLSMIKNKCYRDKDLKKLHLVAKVGITVAKWDSNIHWLLPLYYWNRLWKIIYYWNCLWQNSILLKLPVTK